MSPPPAARHRTALGRLADALRRRLRPSRAAPPATVPGLRSGEEVAVAAATHAEPREPEVEAQPATAEADAEPAFDTPAEADKPAPADAGARIDAARERLRAKIEPPEPDDPTD